MKTVYVAKNWEKLGHEGWYSEIKEDKQKYNPSGMRIDENGKVFIKNRLPDIFNEFYSRLYDGLIASGIDNDWSTEYMEEIVSYQLWQILGKIGLEFYPELFEKIKK